MKKVDLGKGVTVETPWFNIEEAAAYCVMSREFFVRRADEDELPCSGFGKKRLYYSDVLDGWIKGRISKAV